MQKFFRMLEKDDDTLSIGRFCAVVAFVCFIVVSLFLAFSVKVWGNYEVFTVACTAFALVQLGNKAIESRMFSIKSERRKESINNEQRLDRE